MHTFFLLTNALRWLGMALFPNVLHIVTCREKGIICMANRDKLRRPLLGGAPSSHWGADEINTWAGPQPISNNAVADWLGSSGLEAF